MSKDKTDADRKFLALRASGYRGPIDHNGNKVTDVNAWIAKQRRAASGGKNKR